MMALEKSTAMYYVFVVIICITIVLYQCNISQQLLSITDLTKHLDERIVKENVNENAIYNLINLYRDNFNIDNDDDENGTSPSTQTSNNTKTLLSESKVMAQSANATVEHNVSTIIKTAETTAVLNMNTNTTVETTIRLKNPIENVKLKNMFLKRNKRSQTVSTNTAAKVTTTTPIIINNNDVNNNRYYNYTKKIKNILYKKEQEHGPQNGAFTTANSKLMKPPLYIITPTYRRPEQLAELTRLGYTLKHVENLLWLVIEDANTTKSSMVIKTLNRIGVPYEYFLAPMPEQYRKRLKKPRGVSNRNRGLKWLRANATEGVFYFADDDNTYDITIFEQMRYTKKVSMWPVGLVTKFGISSPIVRHGKLVGFYDGFIAGRKYPIDMAGFAVSVQFLHQRPKAKMPFRASYEEDGFLKSLAPLPYRDIELLANNCTEILTWHTQTKKNRSAKNLNVTKYFDTNLVYLQEQLVKAYKK